MNLQMIRKHTLHCGDTYLILVYIDLRYIDYLGIGVIEEWALTKSC